MRGLTAADRSLLDTKKAIESGQLRAAASSYARASRWGLAADLWYARAMAFAAKREMADSTSVAGGELKVRIDVSAVYEVTK